MKRSKLYSTIGGTLLGACVAPSLAEPANDLQEVITNGSYDFDFRYRYEFVDQDGIDKTANASTLRSRLTLTSAEYKRFSALVEVDNVTVVGDERYRTPQNGMTEYPIVADPDGTDLNQLYVRFQGEGFSGVLGRQRIVHGTQRFVGGVAWRQNEQTYDSARLNGFKVGDVTIDYSYIWRVNRIFGPDDSPTQSSTWDSDSHAVTASWAPADGHALEGFSYLLDFDDAQRASSRTFGINYNYTADALSLKASLATQSDYGDNPVGYEAIYYLIEGGYKLNQVKFTAGHEVLGSDGGEAAFATPLATLHVFQGWSDKFLVTPADGIEDTYAGVALPVGPVKLALRYHDFASNEGSTDYGSEVDLVGNWTLNEKFSVQLKYANYMADDYATDTQKFWTTLHYQF